MNTESHDFSWVNYTPEEIENLKTIVEKSIEDEKVFFNKLETSNLTFEKVLGSFDKFSYERHKMLGMFFGFVNLSKDEKVRATARKVEIEMNSLLQAFAYDKNIYNIFISYYKKFYKKEKKNLTGEQIKTVEDTNKAYIQIGMHLDDKNKKLLLKKQDEINKLSSDFEELCAKNYQKGLWFKESKLKGVPESSLKNFQVGEKGYFVRVLPTESQSVMKYCEVTKTREKLAKCIESYVGDINTKKFVKILKLRQEITKILGFKTFSELAMIDEMVNDPEKAKNFLEKIIKSVSKEFAKNLENLNKYAKKHGEKLNTSNSPYLSQLIRKEELNVDEEKYKSYFELENVMSVVFRIWEEFFDLRKEEVSVPAFDSEQNSYKFFDTKSGKLCGYGFFDLHPRDGKYGHACVADYLKKTTIVGNNGKAERSVGATYLVCNFAKNKNGKTLLSFNDVSTLFHECGHMLHDILMKNNYLATGHTSRDFVEIPSQFFENFLLNEKFVKENFKHFETGEEMPADLLSTISKINRKGEAGTWTRVSMTSLFDLELHGKNILKYNTPKKIDNLFEKYWRTSVKIPTLNNRHYLSAFEHLVSGYESRFYSYVVSRVYAQDFWEEFSKGGVKKSKQSDKYKLLLEKANTEKEMNLVKEFLGRGVSEKAFLKYISVK